MSLLNFFSRGLLILSEALCVPPSVRASVGNDRVRKCENAHFQPCPPVRDWYWSCSRSCYDDDDISSDKDDVEIDFDDDNDDDIIDDDNIQSVTMHVCLCLCLSVSGVKRSHFFANPEEVQDSEEAQDSHLITQRR